MYAMTGVHWGEEALRQTENPVQRSRDVELYGVFWESILLCCSLLEHGGEEQRRRGVARLGNLGFILQVTDRVDLDLRECSGDWVENRFEGDGTGSWRPV